MKKINSFIITKIKNLAENEIEMQTLVDSEPCNFILSFHFDENEKLLGFIFQSDLEMLCRANEISLAHNLMEILERVYQNEPLSFPIVVFSNVQHLQTV